MISISGLSKTYGKLKALDDVSLELIAGQAVSLLGPNGSGKTTLIKTILGLVKAQQGSVLVGGKDVSNDWTYRARIGYMPQISRYPENMSIRQVIEVVKRLRPETSAHDDELIQAFGIRAMEGKTMRSLSGGTRQKVSACLAFLFNPDILILDEPTAGLDPVANEVLKEKIFAERAKGKLILITSHVLSDLEGLVSHVVYLQEGKLQFYKSVEELRESTGEAGLNKVIARVMATGEKMQPQ